MKQYVIFLVLCNVPLSVIAQVIFYSSSQYLGNLFRTEIGTFDLINCVDSELYIDTTDGNGYIEWLDIAFCSDGELYGLGHDGVYIIDLVNQSHTKILNGPVAPHRWKKGMACTKDTTLIFGERDLFTFHVNSNDLDYHGRLPAPLNVWANIFWFNGILMGSVNDRIVEIDLLNPQNSQLFCTLPISGFLSLTEVAISCDSIAVFGFHVSGDIYLVNPLDCSIVYYCSIPRLPGEAFEGSSPAFMFMPPEPCTIHIDLDRDDITMAGIDYLDTVYCTLPGAFLFSDLDLYSDKQWDSLLIWIETGPPGVTLEGANNSFSELQGSPSTVLSYFSLVPSNLNSLGPYLNELILSGNMPNGISYLKIGFQAWADDLASDTAYAYITLVGRTTTAGDDNSMNLCTSDPAFSVSSLLSNDATPGGIWQPNLSFPGYFNPTSDHPGSFQYIVADPVCTDDTSVFIIDIFPEPLFDLGADKSLCPGDSALLSVTLPDINFLWSNGSTQNSVIVSEPQTVWLSLIDVYGCAYSDTINILLHDDCLSQRLFIPNVFSPDGNGINDLWGLADYTGIQTIQVSIFDRWGNMLFYDQGSSVSWDGQLKNGDLASPGVYTYLIKVVTTNNNQFLKIGDLTLIR